MHAAALEMSISLEPQAGTLHEMATANLPDAEMIPCQMYKPCQVQAAALVTRDCLECWASLSLLPGANVRSYYKTVLPHQTPLSKPCKR